MAEQDININQDTNQTPWQKSRDQQIQIIQDTAACPTLSNGVAKTLTYQQAMSIWLRASQLAREGGGHSHSISDAERKQQIEICYRQRMQNG